MMTSKPAALTWFGPKLILACALGIATLAGCASGPTRPTTPVYSGNERPEPTRPPRPDAPDPRIDEEEIGERELADIGPEGYTPPHMAADVSSQDLVRVGVLLPLTSPNAGVRREAEGLLAAIEMALFDSRIANAVLLPKDTAGDTETTRQVTQIALAEGADVILGPLFAANVRAAAEIAREAETPLISFSTDRTAAGDGAYLLSVTPEEEVERIVDWAALKGIERFAMFGPRTTYGRRVDAALRYETTRRGAAVFASEFYDANDPSPVLPAQTLAAMVNAEAELAPGKVAVLIPERGVRLRAVAPLMPYYDVDLSIVTLLGTGLWNDPEVWREPSLFGGAFATPDPDAIASFDETYAGEIGQEAPRLASLGYDAAALAVALGEADALSPEALERGDGFVGVNGLFRFNSDGVSEHGLAVLQVSETAGARVVDRARTSFDADGS